MPAENRGVAFSMLHNYPSVIMVVSVAALSAIIFIFTRASGVRLTR